MMSNQTNIVNLPTLAGGTEAFSIQQGVQTPASNATAVPWNREVYAAAHVVCKPYADNSPTLETAVDWDSTLAFRQHLWSQGFGVAEAMDTAQRSMGLDWPTSLEQIQRSTALA